MNIFKLMRMLTNNDFRVVKALSLGKYDEYLYSRCETLDEWKPCEVKFETMEGFEGTSTDILNNDVDYLLFSNRLKKALEGINVVGVKFYEVTVKPEVQEVSPYWYADIMCIKGALDMNQSDCSFYGDPPEISSLVSETIKQDIVKDTDIFRLKEFPPSVYVSDRFRQFFQSMGFLGAEFRLIKTS